jgi:hypothetical protein
MGLINWIFDFYQQHRIEQLRDETTRARVEAAAIRGGSGHLDPARLEQAIGELALALKTVQRLLVEKGVCNPQELHDKLKQIDLEDGRADGRTPID